MPLKQGMMRLERFFCRLGFHPKWEVVDWDAVEGRMRCKRCGLVEHMRGPVLAAWIRYRSVRRRDLDRAVFHYH